ncbi:MBOAT family O-acyltransferase [Pseudomonadota bacterium]
MIFNSVTYLLFLGLVVALYWALPRTPKLLLLFAGSLTFYGFWRWEYIFVMLASVLIDYVVAARIERTENTNHRRFLLLASLMANLGLLAYFKYTVFAVENLNALAGMFGGAGALSIPDILLPIGISFYTFQSVSYTIDVYRRFIPAQRDFLLFANYVVFFPQLIAGPILRAREVFWQLDHRPAFNLDDISIGVRRIFYGLFLKVVLADNIAGYVDDGFALDPATISAWDVWTLAFLFGFQIYFDFSAYSHIAIGSARLMGIKFPENFNFPYLANSPKDFWRRWHISLSSWIRDYLYLPLCGAKVRDESVGGLSVATEKDHVGEGRRTAALFATWAIMGLWHGAAWTFVAWGVWHAVMIVGYRMWASLVRVPRWMGLTLGWAVTLPLMMLGWLPFRAASLGDTWDMFAKVVSPLGYFDPQQFAAGYLMAAFPRNLPVNYYLVAALLVMGVLIAGLARKYAMPLLVRNRWVEFSVQTTYFAVLFAGVFVFLRPIRQFIYFQF